MPTKFLFFDLGNVLIRFSNGRLFQRVGALFDRPPQWVAETLYCPEMLEQAECGHISADEYYRYICEQAPERSVSMDELLHAVNEIFWFNEPMLPTLEQVAQAGLPRGILSNIGPWHWEHCTKAFPEIFENIPDNHVASYKVGAMKPNRDIYAAAFQFARNAVPEIELNEILFIDDLEKNVLGAKDFGFDAVQYSFEEHEKLVEEFHLRGIC